MGEITSTVCHLSIELKMKCHKTGLESGKGQSKQGLVNHVGQAPQNSKQDVLLGQIISFKKDHSVSV